MVVLQERTAIEHIEMVNTALEFRPLARRIGFEGNIRRGADTHDCRKVLLADVSLVGGHLDDLEPLDRRVQQ